MKRTKQRLAKEKFYRRFAIPDLYQNNDKIGKANSNFFYANPPFLNVRPHMTEEGWKLFVYKKNDEQGWLDDNDDKERTKMGIVTGFFLRTRRISNQEFLATEEQYIKDTFHRLGYPPAFVERAGQKAIKIREQRMPPQDPVSGFITSPASPLSLVGSRKMAPTTEVTIQHQDRQPLPS